MPLKKSRSLVLSEELGAGPCGSKLDIVSLFKEEIQTLSHTLTGNKLELLEAAVQEVREGQTDIVCFLFCDFVRFHCKI